MKVEFFRHHLQEEDKQEVRKVLDSLFLTTGEWTKQFETKLATYLSTPYTVGINSCTAGLELVLKYFKIGPGDEVITTPLSFIATANVIEDVGATPVFVDVEAATGNIDATLIESAITDKTKAIMLVHLYGQMCDMKAICTIADKCDLKIIEDAAHCLEGERDGIRVGQAGDAACYSFYATKNLTCGEGGAISCNDVQMYEWLMKARLHGMSKDAADRYNKLYKHYDMEFLGDKCNMSNIEAALLVNQIDRVEDMLSKRKKADEYYRKQFMELDGIDYPKVLGASATKHAYHLFTIWVDPQKRDEYLHSLQQKGVGVAVNFRCIHLMSYYVNKYHYSIGMFPNAEKIASSTISLPLYPGLTREELDYVVDQVKQMIN